MSCIALVVAAGRGSRFGSPLPKQYHVLDARPVLRHCLETFAAHPGISGVRVVISPEDRALYDLASRGLTLLEPVIGGATRQESVLRGLESLAGLAPDSVLIHDGARPLIDAATLDRLLDSLKQGPGAIAAVPVTDTLKRGNEAGTITATVDRHGLWRAQTPQAFHFPVLLAAHQAVARGPLAGTLTDDAAVAEAQGIPVSLVPGSEDNLKITARSDLERAGALLALRRLASGGAADPSGVPVLPRIGKGFDVHRFGEGDQVRLCGVDIPHDQGLAGHSDADVGLHALTDAVLGAVAAGDIGSHFPPSDARWRGVDSAVFLRHAADLVAAAGGRLVHVDLTLVCERPKIGPHRAAMVAKIAEILDLSPDRVSVKATTTEKLGFTGRREGIAAEAVATVLLRET